MLLCLSKSIFATTLTLGSVKKKDSQNHFLLRFLKDYFGLIFCGYPDIGL